MTLSFSKLAFPYKDFVFGKEKNCLQIGALFRRHFSFLQLNSVHSKEVFIVNHISFSFACLMSTKDWPLNQQIFERGGGLDHKITKKW